MPVVLLSLSRWAVRAGGWRAAVGLLCVALAVCGRGAAAAAPSTLVLAQAEASFWPEQGAPVHRTVTLRHRWDEDFPGQGGRALYRLSLPPSPDAQPRALYLPRVGNQVQVRLGGVLLAQYGDVDQPRSDAAKLGRVLLLPPALTLPGQPLALEVDVQAQPLRGAGLAPLQLGPVAAMAALQERQQLLVQGPAAGYAACLLLMGGLAAGLWWRQREPLYASFSLAALCGALRPVDLLLASAPLPWLAWGAVLAMAYGAQLALMARFILLVLGRETPAIRRAILAALGAMAVLASLSFALQQPLLWTLALGLLEALGVATLAVVAHEALARRGGMALVLLGAGIMTILAGTHDLLLVRMGLAGGAGLPLTPHALFIFVLILAGLVVTRFNRTVADYRALNAELAARVAEREAELRGAFEALRAQQQERAVLDERQRIMREIHDGIGSQLVGLLSMVRQRPPQPEQMEEHVRNALDEMRMAVDSLQPVHSDLTTVLATLRYRLQPRLEAANLKVIWDVGDLPPLPGLSPQAVLQVQRILLEAFTNVLKHAGATEVTMHARWLPSPEPAVLLELRDNGQGLQRAPVREGSYGLGSMRARAQSIGARLSVGNAPEGGCCVSMRWPVPMPPS